MKAQLKDVNVLLSTVEKDLSEVKNLNVSFDIRIDRLQATVCESLNVTYNIRAGIRVLQAEVSAWTQDVAALQKRVA